MTNRKTLESLLRGKVTEQLIDQLVYVTESVISVVPDPIPTKLPTLREFIVKLIRYTHVYKQTLVMTLCYLNRLREKLPSDSIGVSSTRHRIFLACLILSAKNHNDSSPRNKYWTKYTDGLFTLQDVNLMERQLLEILEWDIVIGEEELWKVVEPLLSVKSSYDSSVCRLGRKDSVRSNLSSSSTLVNALSQPNINNPSRKCFVVNSLKKRKSVVGNNGTARDDQRLEKGGKMRSLWRLLKQYGF